MFKEFLKPRFSNMITTIVFYGIYYLIVNPPFRCDLGFMCPNNEIYKSYISFIGKCGQTCSQPASILSLVLLIIALPLIYIIVSLILHQLRKK